MISPLYAHMLGEFPSEVWALAIGLAWLLLALSVDDALLILGTRRAKTARQTLGTTELTFFFLGKNTIWLFNIAMGNCPFTDDFPIKNSIYNGFSIAMLNNQMVSGFWVDIYDIYDIYLLGTPPRKHGLMLAGSPSQQQLSKWPCGRFGLLSGFYHLVMTNIAMV